MIKSFGNDFAALIYQGKPLPRKLSNQFPAELIKKAVIQLDLLNRAGRIEDLYFPPSNHFEALSGDLSGYYSIRINRQWRIVFRWNDGNAEEARIMDYH
jgi:proteic killer suppression protein